MPEVGDSSQGSRDKYRPQYRIATGGRAPTKQLALKPRKMVEAEGTEGPPMPAAEQVLEDVASALNRGGP
ncbi:hypothetical protein FRC12_012995 [Ceratobasidium sp. 428]|nr:hypothetical protein FRC12_012995 [Ceratobasidium sp. 428]